MVLESLFSSTEILQHPVGMLFIAVLVGSASLWTAYLTFPGSASVLAIAFLTIALVPVIHRIFTTEEKREAERPGYAALFVARHFNVVKVYAFFFIGLVLTYALWYSVMPEQERGIVFSEQEKTLGSIGQLRETLTGQFTASASACKSNPVCWFEVIFFNNAFVLVLAIAFSFLYGAGAVFLVGWNASVIGVLIGKDIIQASAASSNLFGGVAVGLYNALGLIPHGLFESLGYFLGAIAGGIVGAAISKRRHLRGEMTLISKDITVMLFYSVGLLIIGALIEAHAIAFGI